MNNVKFRQNKLYVLVFTPKPGLSAKTMRLNTSSAKTQREHSSRDTDFFPVLNASKVPLSDIETLLLSKGLNFCPTAHEVDDKEVKIIKEHFLKVEIKGTLLTKRFQQRLPK